VNIETIREQIRAGNYLIKSHAVQHALKEGFERKHMVEAILEGRIIEEYPDDQRAPICGRASISNVSLYLHVVCEYADPMYTEFVTAYIPDVSEWEWPPFRRRRR
jgi:hypothetical protein